MLQRFLICLIFAVTVAAQQRDTRASLQISGRVVDGVTGQPISGARVGIGLVSQSQAAVTIMSSEDGSFLFADVLPGKYNLMADRRGYLTAFFDQHDGFSSAIVVGPGLDNSNLIFRLFPECSISGTISDEAGEPVRHAQLTLFSSSIFEGRPVTRMYLAETTDEEGSYRFRHLQPGRYYIAVTAEPWYAQRPRPRMYDGYTSHTENLQFFEPQRAAGQYAEDEGPSPLDVAYPITFYPGVTEATAATALVLKTGEKFVADITLQPVPALHLRIPELSSSNAKQISMGQLQTRLFGAPMQLPVQTLSRRKGELEIVGVAPGHYEFEVQEVNEGKSTVSSFLEIDAARSGPIQPEQKTSLVSVSAVIKIEGNPTAPVEGDLQLINTGIQESISEHFSGDGPIEFKQQVRPGTYEVMIGTSSGEFIKTLSATGAVVSGRTLQIKESGSVKLAITLARGHGEVTGVALRESKPLSGAMIVLVPADPAHNYTLFRRDQSDSDGTFTLRWIVPGKYTVLALEKGWDLEWWKPSVLKRYLANGTVVDVEQNGKYDAQVKVQEATLDH